MESPIGPTLEYGASGNGSPSNTTNYLGVGLGAGISPGEMCPDQRAGANKAWYKKIY